MRQLSNKHYLFIIILLIIIFIIYFLHTNIMNYTNYNYIIKNNVLSNQNKTYLNVGIWDNINNNLQSSQLNMYKKIFYIAELYKNQKVLETGCGSGEHYLYWKKLGLKSHITCFEKSTKPFNKLHNIKYINFVKNDANNLNIYNYYDKIISIESAFHYKNRHLFFQKCYQALKKGGSLIMTDIIVNNNQYSNYTDTLLKQYYSQQILNIPRENIINQETYIHQLKKAGFSVIQVNDISNVSLIPFYQNINKNINNNNKIYTPTILKKFNEYSSNFIITQKPFAYIFVKCTK